MKPNAYMTDEGEQNIEWIGADARFGLAFDQEGQSSWFYVTKAGAMQSGPLAEEIMDALANGLYIAGDEEE